MIKAFYPKNDDKTAEFNFLYHTDSDQVMVIVCENSLDKILKDINECILNEYKKKAVPLWNTLWDMF